MTKPHGNLYIYIKQDISFFFAEKKEEEGMNLIYANGTDEMFGKSK